jgi:predicted Fe-Mo cluster-binding NifX family protein
LPHRIAYAVAVRDGRECIAESFGSADQLRICNVSGGDIKRVTLERMPETLGAIVARLKRKKVGEIFVRGQGAELERMACENDGIKYSVAERDEPRVYGCDEEDDSLE